MTRSVLHILSVLSLLFIAACSSTQETATLSVEERYAQGKSLFDNGDYLEAIEDFKAITVQDQGSDLGDDAQFYLAECRYRRGEYILAAAEYDNLVRSMPGSPYVNRARYMRAQSYYELSPKSQLDQKYTRFALDNFQTFVEYASKDSLTDDATAKINELTLKLSRKMFEGGKLYFRLEYYRAAIAYFDKLIQEYHDSPYVDDGMLWKAKSLNERKDFDGAERVLAEIDAKFPETDLKEEMKELRAKIATDRVEYQQDEQKRKLTTMTQ